LTSTGPDLDAILAGFRSKAKRVAYKVLNGTRVFDVEAAAEDVAQTVITELWRKLGDGLLTIEEWKVRKLAESRAIDSLRSAGRQRSRAASLDYFLDMGIEPTYPDWLIETEELPDVRLAPVLAVLGTFRPEVQEVFDRFYLSTPQESETIQEISDALSVPEGSVKRWLSEGRERIRRKLAIAEPFPSSRTNKGIEG
jgi:RNA polymerase sigma factor (sigma-70 family)